MVWSCWLIFFWSSALTGRLFSSVLLCTSMSPLKDMCAWSVASLCTTMSTSTGQSLNKQYPEHLKRGAFLFDPITLTLWPRNAKLQYGFTERIPFDITFVHCSPLKWFLFCFFLRFLHAERGMKKNDGVAGRLWMKNSSSLSLASSSSSASSVSMYFSCVSVFMTCKICQC